MNRIAISLLLVSACAANTDPSSESPDGGVDTGSGSGMQPATCDPSVNQLRAGSSLTLNSNTTGANPQRDYCIVVPSTATQVRLDTAGGSCGQFNCTGDDVRMCLKRGAVPDAYSPDASTTSWSYTPDPNGYGMYVKAAQPGIWYLSIIDGQYSLGYTDVTLKLSFP